MTQPRIVVDSLIVRLLDEVLKVGVESGVFAYIYLLNLSLGVYKYFGRESLNTVSAHHTAFGIGVVEVHPGEFVLLHGGTPVCFRVIAVNAYDLEFALILSVGVFQAGEAFMHQMHQEPQKSITTHLPLKLLSFTILPLRSGKEKSGALA